MTFGRLTRALACGLAMAALWLATGEQAAQTRSPELLTTVVVKSPKLVRAGAVPCGSQQLRASASFEGGGGSQLGGLILRNASHRTCSLPTSAPIVEIVWHDTVLKTLERPMPPVPASGRIPVRVLEPAQRAVIYMQWFNWCGKPPENPPIHIALKVHLGRHTVLDIPLSEPVNAARCDSPGAASVLAVTAPLRPE